VVKYGDDKRPLHAQLRPLSYWIPATMATFQLCRNRLILASFVTKKVKVMSENEGVIEVVER
jgi:hypothetical protein